MRWNDRAVVCMMTAVMALGAVGCSSMEKQMQESDLSQKKKEGTQEESLQIAEGFRDVYEEAQAEGNLKDRQVQEELIRAIGEQGYAAVDTENRINMVNSEQMETFLQEAGQGREAEASMFCVTDEGGFIRYDLETRESVMDVTVSSLRWQNGEPEVWYTHDFEATDWEFTEKGYFFLEEARPAGYDGAPGQKAFRIRPLDADCRQEYEKYLSMIGYERNNMLITDWSEENYGDLEFYDLFERLYQAQYGSMNPYEAHEGARYEVPQELVENVLCSRFRIDIQTLRQRMTYHAAGRTYEYRPRGLRDGGAPYGPVPEVTACERQKDGTLCLTVDAVWPREWMERALQSRLVVRLLENGSFQYVSNQVVYRDARMTWSWYEPRFTEEEWEQYYGTEGK